MAIALRASSGATTTASGTLAVPVPAGTVAGDVLVIGVHVGLSASVPANPAGLTFISGASGGPSFGSWYRICDGTEPASYSFTVAAASSGTSRTYSGVDNTTPINAQATPNRSAALATATASSITSTVNGCVLVWFSGITANNPTLTNPTGFANQQLNDSATGSASSGSCDKAQGTAGATGTVQGTWSIAGNNYAQVIALAPSAAVGSGLPPHRLRVGTGIHV